MPDGLPWDQFKTQATITPDSSHPVIVIGAGLAGCWMARTLAESGIRVRVLDAGAGIACGASKNPAGIVKPFVTRSPGLAMNFHVQAHELLRKRLFEWTLDRQAAYVQCGVIQRIKQPYPDSCHYTALQGAQWEASMGLSSKENVGQHETSGVTNDDDNYGLLFEQAGWLNPSSLCHALLEHELIQLHTHWHANTIERLSDGMWHATSDQGICFHSTHIVMATGAALAGTALTRNMPITPARGQLSRFLRAAGNASPARVISAKHYVIPDGDTVIVGATFERDVCDEFPRSEDDMANYKGLQDALSSVQVYPDAVASYCGIRATTPDRLPLLGPIPDAQACQSVYGDLHHGRNLHAYPVLPIHEGAFVLGGLGSRGIVTAPLAAHLLANYMSGGNEIRQWAPIINPARFQIRQLKRSAQPV